MKQVILFKGESIILGGAMFDKQAIPGLQIKIPLNTANRHGLIAGATGTGKTKTIQRLAEGLSEKGVSVLVMDVKGDLSGIAAPGVRILKFNQDMNRSVFHGHPDSFLWRCSPSPERKVFVCVLLFLSLAPFYFPRFLN